MPENLTMVRQHTQQLISLSQLRDRQTGEANLVRKHEGWPGVQEESGRITTRS
jgi:hypothetical protein